jgi:hypothetical protein
MNHQTCTIDGAGVLLTIEQEGVSMPADYSFRCVNDYVHDSGRHFEELQCLALGMACEIERLRKDAEQYVPVHEAIQQAAGELPNGWEIRLCVERDGGGVELYGPGGTEEQFASDHERLDYTITDALEAALATQGGAA